MSILSHSWFITVRQLRNISRMPFVIFMNLIQPILWLVLFSSVFSNIVNIPGFSSSSYITFLAPGIVVMSTFSAGSYAGMSIISDDTRGVLSRFLVTPIHRSALILGPLAQNTITMIIQGLIMILLSLALGAKFAGGISGILILIICSVLVGVGFGALSMALALLIRKEEGLMSAVGFAMMPLMFLSGLFMPLDLVPRWIQVTANFNPINWASIAGREALGANIDWALILSHSGYLLTFVLVSIWLATKAFRKYQHAA